MMKPNKHKRGSPFGLTPSQCSKSSKKSVEGSRRRRLFDQLDSSTPTSQPSGASLPDHPQPSRSITHSTSQPSGSTDSCLSSGIVRAIRNPACSRLYPPSLEWSTAEDKALTDFVLFSSAPDTWSSTKSTRLWEGAATFVKNMTGVQRTSK